MSPDTKRIEYIDAMRGFTMFLVVLAHCGTYCMDLYDGNIYLEICQSFRMPLFFWVSGFVFYKNTRSWTRNEINGFMRKKIPVQVIFPFLFCVAYAYVAGRDIPSVLLDPMKGGYWFTFTLFEFFCIYIMLELTLKKIKFAIPHFDLFPLILAVVFLVLTHERVMCNMPEKELMGAFGVSQLQYFLYFVLGIMSKKYYDQFQQMLNSPWLITVCVLSCIALFLFKDYLNYPGVSYCVLILKALFGIAIVVSLFRNNESFFNKDRKIGNILQFIGKRTLDIYLLHYFFLPQGLTPWFKQLSSFDIPLLELVIAIILSIIVIGMSLFVSSVLRLSPMLSRYAFGQRKINKLN